jgi:hypothetical protein
MHGVGGIGKTAFAAQARKPFFILSPGETGLHTLIDSGAIPAIQNFEADSWESTLGIIEQLTSTDHDYQTLVLDVLDGIEPLAKDVVCKQFFAGDWGQKGYANFANGDKTVANQPWRFLLASLDKLRETKKMQIIGLAHTGEANKSNPHGADYSREVPKLYKDTWALTYGWADMVLFAHFDVEVSKNKTDRKGKGHGGQTRSIETCWDAAFDAKNRHNLPPQIPMGESAAEAWSNLTNAIKEGRQTGKE